MKTKVTGWGNSHGIRITSAMLDHLNIGPGEDVNIDFTNRGIEINKRENSIDHAKLVTQEALNSVLEATAPVGVVSDPYAESDICYIVITIDPCNPIIREVSKGTAQSYATLADAKEAARQVLQTAIAKAKDSLSELR